MKDELINMHLAILSTSDNKKIGKLFSLDVVFIYIET